MGPYPTSEPSAPQPQDRHLEVAGLRKLVWFGIIQVVGIAGSWVVSFLTFQRVFIASANLNLPPHPTPADVSAALGPLFQSLWLVIPIGLAIQLVAMALLLLGYRDFGKVDKGNFSLPSTLMLVLIAGVFVAAAGIVPLLMGIPDLIAKAPSTTGGTPSADFLATVGSIFIYIALAAVGGLLALIGVVGGEILGLWRVGSRYDEILIKLGAIFVIVPFLNVVAPVLVLVGASQAKGRVAKAG